MGKKGKAIFMIVIMVFVFSGFYKELVLHEKVHGEICEGIVDGNLSYDYGFFKATTSCNYTNATAQEELLFQQLNIQNEIEAYNWLGAKSLFILIFIFIVFLFFQLDDISNMLKYRLQKEEVEEARK